MAQVELFLNARKPGNYAFFCPVSKLHLTLSSPVGIYDTDVVTSYILRAIKSKTLLDVKGVVDLETGKVSAATQNTSTETEVPEKVEDVKLEAAATKDLQEELPSQEAEAPVETPVQVKTETAPVDKGKKGKKNQTVEETAATETATQSEE